VQLSLSLNLIDQPYPRETSPIIWEKRKRSSQKVTSKRVSTLITACSSRDRSWTAILLSSRIVTGARPRSAQDRDLPLVASSCWTFSNQPDRFRSPGADIKCRDNQQFNLTRYHDRLLWKQATAGLLAQFRGRRVGATLYE
jgi:hypothetical protein